MFMKTLFIEARYAGKVKLSDAAMNQLSKNAKNIDKIALFTTLQFIDSLPSIKAQLESKKLIVELLKPLHCKYQGQLLGCSISTFKTDADAFLYIGDGMFHPIALKINNEKPVFAFNPFTKKLSEITENDTQKMQQQQKAALVNFHSSKEIGILVSTKPGQNNLKKAQELEKKYPYKKFYLLLFDTLDFNQLENFPFIECYVNTACPRISYDDSDKFMKKVVDVNLIL